ncbi:MAG TPA: hypothetical protein VGC86_05390 [Afipia sp.]
MRTMRPSLIRAIRTLANNFLTNATIATSFTLLKASCIVFGFGQILTAGRRISFNAIGLHLLFHANNSCPEYNGSDIDAEFFPMVHETAAGDRGGSLAGCTGSGHVVLCGAIEARAFPSPRTGSNWRGA